MSERAIAIVGMAGRFPGARGLDDFWRNVRDGVEALDPLSDADLDAARIDPVLRAHPSYVKKTTFLEDADLFDAAFFGFSPREAQTLDPQQRIFLETARDALEHAGHAGGSAGQSVGVYAGVGMNSYLIAQLLANPPFVASVGGYQLMVGNDKDFLATRISYKLDLRGPSLTVQTACSTSLVAVELACRALQHGECDLALAGGVSIFFPQRGGYLFEEGMIFSPDGHCRPFDAEARGTRGGAGAGVVVLKRLADALADRDTIHAVILGAAINNDGAAKAGYTAPSVEGQVEVIATAQALGKVDPRSIGYIEAHGTGTPLGDPIEIAALTQVFRAKTKDLGFCRLGSLKANIGHLDAAAGVAGLIKAVLALEHAELPPLVNFKKANPQLDLERSPFMASATAAPWPRGDGPRRAGVSSFGIGGTNAHVVLEEAPPVEPTVSARAAELLVLSAKTPAALEQATAELAAHLRDRPDASLADVAWTLQVGRQHFPNRRAVVARDARQAAELLAAPPRPPVLTGAAAAGARPIAFLFSGQGSQHAGMGAGLYRGEPIYRAVIDRCAEVLQPLLGLDLRDVLCGDAAHDLNETRLTQPLLFATEVALAALWRSWGIVPAAMLGHSIGEYAAAHLAGVFTLEDGLALVAARGRLMGALPPGTMAAVHRPAAELAGFVGHGVELAAVNAPGLCTISGPAPAVAALLARLEAAGIESRALHTSHAFHSAMMEPALAPFTDVVAGVTLSPPAIPYLSNLTGTWITVEQATTPAYWAQHLRQAVRFEAGVRVLAADPALMLLEVGPGTALTSLARLTVGKDGPRRVVPSLSHPREARADAEATLEAAAKLWLAGAALDWAGLHGGERPRRVPLPTYPYERKRHWVDALPAAAAPSAASGPRVAASIEELFYAPTWAREDSPAPTPPRLEGAWLVLAPPGALGEAVARHLQVAGGQPVMLEPAVDFHRSGSRRFQATPGNPDHLGSVVRSLAAESLKVAGAIDLWGMPVSPMPAFTRTELGYHGLVALAATLAGGGSTARRIIVGTAGAESVLSEPVRDLEGALALGPVTVMPTEIPGVLMRSVDVDLEPGPDGIEVAARELVEEATRMDAERFVARRAGRRWVRRYDRLSLPADAATLSLRSRGFYLITGGTGGVGLALARWLGAKLSARLLLTGRRPLPERDGWDAWLAERAPDDRISEIIRAVHEIEAAGGEVLVAAADATDEPAMRRAIDDARRRWGELHGVIHGAGAAGSDKPASLKSLDEVAAVLAPKVEGLAVLTRILGGAPLEFVALLSSLSTTLGGLGLSDYVAANAVLDAFVDSTARPPGWRRVVALNYGAWRDVGMAARAVSQETRQRVREAFHRSALASDMAIEAFARVLSSTRARVVIAPFDVLQAVEIVGRQINEAATAQVRPRAPSASPSEGQPPATSSVAPATDHERQLAAIWSDLLGVERIGVHDDFFELGGHSLLATRVLARIDVMLGARLTLRDIFDAPTVHRLAQRVAAVRGATTAVEEDREELDF